MHSNTLIFMRNVPGQPRMRALTQELACLMPGGWIEQIPVGFMWDGSSVPWVFQGFFPRHWHPIASCRHDWRCLHAKNANDRLFADREFREDVGQTSWWITKQAGYLGVRIGALLGVGKHY
jgi:hypothetical protein